MRDRTVLLMTLLSTIFVFVTSCGRAVSEQPRPNASPAVPAPTTVQREASHSNQVTVTLAKISPETARLNPRIAEAYSPDTVKRERTASAPNGFPGSTGAREESPQPGMSWLVVIVDHDAVQGEVSIPISQIRIIDRANRSYRLISFGAIESDTFEDLREYDKYKMVAPPKLVMQSPAVGKQSLLFAVAKKSAGLVLEF